jgi:hypothetical protein
MLRRHIGAHHLRTPPLKVLQVTEHGNIAHQTADVRGRKAQDIGCRSIEASDGEITPEKDDRNTDRI